MSDEIDLQLYLAAIRRYWWLILLVVVLALALTAAINLAQPKHYDAVATLQALSPRLQWRFDTSILPLTDARRDYQREFLAISRSNRIAQRAAAQLQESGALPGATPSSLLSSISVRAGDGSTLLVTATADTPEQAAAIANAWAAAFVELGRNLSGVSNDLANYKAELEIAAQRLRQAEQDLAKARTATGLFINSDSSEEQETSNLRQRQITLKNQRLAEYLNDIQSLNYLASLVESAGAGADLTGLPWELLNGPAISQRGVLTPQGVRSALDDPQGLTAALRQEAQDMTATAEQLKRESDDLQAQLAADWQAYGIATRQYNLARETYNLMSRKVDEASVQERIDPSQLILVSEAVPPSSPAQTRQLARLAVAGVIGLIVGVLLALWLGLRRSGNRPAAEPVQAGR